MFKNIIKKIDSNELSKDIYDSYYVEDYQCIDLHDVVEDCLISIVKDKFNKEVEEVLKEQFNSQNTQTLNDEEYEEELEYYIEENKFDFICENVKDIRLKIVESIEKMFDKDGYDCYCGEIFPYDGRFINNNCTHAFVKRDNN